MIKEKGYIKLTRRIFETEQGAFAASCDELGIATCGKSFEEAERRLDKSILLVLNMAARKGESERLLSEKGVPFYISNRVPKMVALTTPKWLVIDMTNIKLIWRKYWAQIIGTPSGIAIACLIYLKAQIIIDKYQISPKVAFISLMVLGVVISVIGLYFIRLSKKRSLR